MLKLSTLRTIKILELWMTYRREIDEAEQLYKAGQLCVYYHIHIEKVFFSDLQTHLTGKHKSCSTALAIDIRPHPHWGHGVWKITGLNHFD